MANSLLTSLAGLSAAASGDVIYLTDISDQSENAAGTNKKITYSNLIETATITMTNKTLTSPVINTPALSANSVDAITEIASALKSGSDATLVTGTAGTSGDLSQWNGDGDLVDGPIPPTGTILGSSDTQEMSNKTHDGDFALKNSTDNITSGGAGPDFIIELPAATWTPTTTAGCATIVTVEAGTNDIDYKVLDFDDGADENAFVNFQMPTNYDGGVIQFRYVWTNAGGGSAETVTFELSGIAIADNGAIDQAVGTPIEVADTFLAQGDIHISSFSGNVTLAGSPAGGQWVHLEIMRDFSEDDLTGDARLMGVQIKYKTSQYSN